MAAGDRAAKETFSRHRNRLTEEIQHVSNKMNQPGG